LRPSSTFGSSSTKRIRVIPVPAPVLGSMTPPSSSIGTFEGGC
jgi:hypothetical protein